MGKIHRCQVGRKLDTFIITQIVAFYRYDLSLEVLLQVGGGHAPDHNDPSSPQLTAGAEFKSV